MYEVILKNKVQKSIRKMPDFVQQKMFTLVDRLETLGPIQTEWPNYSKLSQNEYHCHLSKNWVACWRHDKGTIIIEVYYAGSRENTPY
jgi:hypothetical protein